MQRVISGERLGQSRGDLRFLDKEPTSDVSYVHRCISGGVCQYSPSDTRLPYQTQAATGIGKGKGKVFPYSLPSVGPGADPGVQAVSPQVT